MPLTRRIPKRGFTNIFRQPWAIVNLRDLKRFAGGQRGGRGGPERGRPGGRQEPRGSSSWPQGEVTVALTVKVQGASAQAKARIEAAGGRVEVV